MSEKTVTIKKGWLAGMISMCMSLGVEEFEAAVVERDGKFVLSCERVGDEIKPKFRDGENLHREKERESYQKAIAAGLSPIWRDKEGNFCRKDDDADGKPEFYLENCSDGNLMEVAGKTGVPVKEGLTRDNLIVKLKKHFGFKIDESEEVLWDAANKEKEADPGETDAESGTGEKNDAAEPGVDTPEE